MSLSNNASHNNPMVIGWKGEVNNNNLPASLKEGIMVAVITVVETMEIIMVEEAIVAGADSKLV